MHLDIERSLEKALPPENTYPEVIHQSMRYSVMAGGKRLRPILLLSACEIVGGSKDEAMPFACAIELIHTYSLIHDDLPPLDNDDFRRGKLTNHKVYGEDIAILAGDGLLNYAYEYMIDSALNSHNSLRFLQAMKEISTAAGIKGMISGQVLDLINENQTIDLETLDYIHRHKTGALIRAAIASGAIIGGATSEQLKKLDIYGQCIGLGFQIVDDILDVVGDQEVIGKKVGSDVSNNKCTYPSLVGIEKSKELTKELTNKAIESLDEFGDKKTFLVSLAKYLLNRNI